MPRTARALLQLPPATAGAIEKIGADLAVARLRLKESLRAWQRLGVTVSTLQRLEAGDPSVSMGIVATALWLIQRDGELRHRAAPEHDKKVRSSGTFEQPSSWAARAHERRRRRAAPARPKRIKTDMRLDELYLWFLGDPAAQRLVGELRTGQAPAVNAWQKPAWRPCARG